MSKKEKKSPETKEEFPGYPIYPDNEDIYVKDLEEKDINPEDLSKTKTPNEKQRKLNEKDFIEDVSAGDLDISGAGSDDDIDIESPGNEDEENSYYSLGGDNHNNLEENIGD